MKSGIPECELLTLENHSAGMLFMWREVTSAFCFSSGERMATHPAPVNKCWNSRVAGWE
jgi:hypothetical protein